jgi:Zn-dependent peptidase ImmA (M78 family)
MSGFDFKVAPRSWDEIAQICDRVREVLQLTNEPKFPIMEVLEDVLDHQLGLVRFEVGSNSEMGVTEGHTCPKGEFIELREDVYRLACEDDGRSRFTAAHELGHFIMHTNVPLARMAPNENVKPFRLSEAQANQFAAELLMPPRFFKAGDDEHEVMERHGVSRSAAIHRLSYLRKKGKIPP